MSHYQKGTAEESAPESFHVLRQEFRLSFRRKIRSYIFHLAFYRLSYPERLTRAFRVKCRAGTIPVSRWQGNITQNGFNFFRKTACVRVVFLSWKHFCNTGIVSALLKCLAEGHIDRFFPLVSSGIQTRNFSVTGPMHLPARLPATLQEEGVRWMRVQVLRQCTRAQTNKSSMW